MTSILETNDKYDDNVLINPNDNLHTKSSVIIDPNDELSPVLEDILSEYSLKLDYSVSKALNLNAYDFDVGIRYRLESSYNWPAIIESIVQKSYTFIYFNKFNVYLIIDHDDNGDIMIKGARCKGKNKIITEDSHKLFHKILEKIEDVYEQSIEDITNGVITWQ